MNDRLPGMPNKLPFNLEEEVFDAHLDEVERYLTSEGMHPKDVERLIEQAYVDLVDRAHTESGQPMLSLDWYLVVQGYSVERYASRLQRVLLVEDIEHTRALRAKAHEGDFEVLDGRIEDLEADLAGQVARFPLDP